ncbi:hypothetical protein SIN8267_01999 [Sinobacterium norvegicum]|uniref:Uncharacterized protein n=1 Tax=Sinobacterium norvegicum TaxID=1641715 RepID=A0ABM9AFV3_9GAMM|nr:hypothetical protein SIN8267_01999 [Sinobacterium norvegicum]
MSVGQTNKSPAGAELFIIGCDVLTALSLLLNELLQRFRPAIFQVTLPRVVRI